MAPFPVVMVLSRVPEVSKLEKSWVPTTFSRQELTALEEITEG
jgi:hypothetical protein